MLVAKMCFINNRVATGQAKSVQVRPSQEFCGQNGQKSAFLAQNGKKSVFFLVEITKCQILSVQIYKIP